MIEFDPIDNGRYVVVVYINGAEWWMTLDPAKAGKRLEMRPILKAVDPMHEPFGRYSYTPVTG